MAVRPSPVRRRLPVQMGGAHGCAPCQEAERCNRRHRPTAPRPWRRAAGASHGHRTSETGTRVPWGLQCAHGDVSPQRRGGRGDALEEERHKHRGGDPAVAGRECQPLPSARMLPCALSHRSIYGQRVANRFRDQGASGHSLQGLVALVCEARGMDAAALYRGIAALQNVCGERGSWTVSSDASSEHVSRWS